MAFCMPYPSYSTGGVVHAASGVEAKINELRNKYPNGQYWHKVNGVNAVTTIPCSHKDGSVYNLNSDSTNGCGKTYLGWQCVGFASQIFYEIFGENITDYRGTRTDKENIMIGDYVRINNTHSFIVTARYGNTRKCVECNWSGPCRIGWDQEHSISQVTGFYHASNYDEINNINVSPEL